MILLCTDFGLEGPYVGQVKAVLARAAPGVPVIDLFADLPAFAPQPAAYLLAAYTADLTPGDVVLAVVDPGVGGARKALALEADRRWFVGPDNGLLEIVRRRATETRTFALADRGGGIAPTFHGRDVFAPAAARLALGLQPQGEPAAATAFDDWPDDLPAVVYVDRYGNAMTGLRARMLGVEAVLHAGGVALPRARTFSDAPQGGLLWYQNANGLAEIALNGGSAARHLGLSPGTAVGIGRPGEVAPLPPGA